MIRFIYITYYILHRCQSHCGHVLSQAISPIHCGYISNYISYLLYRVHHIGIKPIINLLWTCPKLHIYPIYRLYYLFVDMSQITLYIVYHYIMCRNFILRLMPKKQVLLYMPLSLFRCGQTTSLFTVLRYITVLLQT